MSQNDGPPDHAQTIPARQIVIDVAPDGNVHVKTIGLTPDHVIGALMMAAEVLRRQFWVKALAEEVRHGVSLASRMPPRIG